MAVSSRRFGAIAPAKPSAKNLLGKRHPLGRRHPLAKRHPQGLRHPIGKRMDPGPKMRTDEATRRAEHGAVFLIFESLNSKFLNAKERPS